MSFAISFFFTRDSSGLPVPPTHPSPLLQVGGFDPLLDDAVDFDTRLRRLGVASSLHVENALPHGFSGLVYVSKHARRAIETGTRFLEGTCFRDACMMNDDAADADGRRFYGGHFDPSAPVPLSPDRHLK